MSARRWLLLAVPAFLLASSLAAVGQPACAATLPAVVSPGAGLAYTDCEVLVRGDVEVQPGAHLSFLRSTLRFDGPGVLHSQGTLSIGHSLVTGAVPYTVVIGSQGYLDLRASDVEGHNAFILRGPTSQPHALVDTEFRNAVTGLTVDQAYVHVAGLAFKGNQLAVRVAGTADLSNATFAGPQPYGILQDGTVKVSPTTPTTPTAFELRGTSQVRSVRAVTVSVTGATGPAPVEWSLVDQDGKEFPQALSAHEGPATVDVPITTRTATTATTHGPWMVAASSAGRVGHALLGPGEASVSVPLGPEPDAAAPAWPDGGLRQLAQQAGYSRNGSVALTWDAPTEGGPERAVKRYEVRTTCATAPCPLLATTRIQRNATVGPFADGVVRLEVHAVDLAGNTAATSPLQVHVDQASPVLTHTELDSPGPGQGLHRGPVRIALAASDTGSGLTSLTYRIGDGLEASYSEPLRFEDDGNHTLVANATDAAGHVRSLRIPVAIDRVPPQLAVGTSPGPSPQGWHARSTNLTLAASDAVAGIAQLRYRVDGGAWRNATATTRLDLAAGRHVVEAQAVDRVGEVANATLTVAYDGIPPTLALASAAGTSAAAWALAPVEVAVEAADPQSGIARLQARTGNGTWSDIAGTLRFASSGTHALQVRAEDLAGNQAAATRVVRLDLEDPAPPQATWSTGDDGRVRGDWAQAKAFDVGSGLARLAIERDDAGTPRLLQEAATSSTGAVLEGLPAGRHRIRLHAEDHAGRHAQTAWTTVTVPPGGAQAGKGPERVVRGVATLGPPPLEGIEEVRFYLDGQLLAAVGEAPFTYPWDTRGVADGEHQVRIVVADADGLLHQGLQRFQVRNGYLSALGDHVLPGGAALAGLLAAAVATLTLRRRTA